MQITHTSKTTHVIQTLKKEGVKPEEVWVWLKPSLEASPFYCYNCGKFQFNRQHRVIAISEDNITQALKSTPISPQCWYCGTIFHINIT